MQIMDTILMLIIGISLLYLLVFSVGILASNDNLVIGSVNFRYISRSLYRKICRLHRLRNAIAMRVSNGQDLHDFCLNEAFFHMPNIARLYQTYLIFFRYTCLRFSKKYPKYTRRLGASIFSLILCLFGLHYYYVILMLFFEVSELAFMATSKYYKKRPTLLSQNLPQLLNAPYKCMWSKAEKLLVSAAQNPERK